MIQYTIVTTFSGVAVFDGKLKGAKLKYQGGNLEVYIRGACPLAIREKVHYHAMSLARAHHIPLSQFKAYGWV